LLGGQARVRNFLGIRCGIEVAVGGLILHYMLRIERSFYNEKVEIREALLRGAACVQKRDTNVL
jgi:hypothetical protein